MRLPKKALQRTCHFRWLKCPKSVRSYIEGVLIKAATGGDTVLRQAAEGKVRLVSKVNFKWIWKSTSGRVRQCAAKRTCGFPCLHQEEGGFFQSKWSLLNNKEFLSRARKSVFRHTQISLHLRGFWEFLHFWIYFILFFHISTNLFHNKNENISLKILYLRKKKSTKENKLYKPDLRFIKRN